MTTPGQRDPQSKIDEIVRKALLDDAPQMDYAEPQVDLSAPRPSPQPQIKPVPSSAQDRIDEIVSESLKYEIPTPKIKSPSPPMRQPDQAMPSDFGKPLVPTPYLTRVKSVGPLPGEFRVPNERLTPNQLSIRKITSQMQRDLKGMPSIEELDEQISLLDPVKQAQRYDSLDRQLTSQIEMVGRLQELSNKADEEGMSQEASILADLSEDLQERSFTASAWSGATKFFEWLDSWTGAPGRELTAKEVLGEKQYEALAADPSRWAKSMAKAADEGNPMAQALVFAPDAVGSALGSKYALGGFMAGMAVLSDLAAGRPTNWKLIDEMQKETGEDIRDLLLMMEVDWTTFIPGLGGAKALKTGTKTFQGTRGNVARSAIRMARKTAGKNVQKAKVYEFVDDVAELARYADEPDIMKKHIIPTFEKYGYTADQAARAFGKRGEFFGADLPSFLPTGLPFIGKQVRAAEDVLDKGIDGMLKMIGPKATYVSDPYLIRKGLQAAKRKGMDTAQVVGRGEKRLVRGLNAPGQALLRGYEAGFDLFDPDRRFLKGIQKIVKTSKNLREGQILQRFRAISNTAPVDAERRMYIAKEIFDPSVPYGKKSIAEARKLRDEKIAALSKSEQKYVREMEAFFDEIYQEAVTAGYLKKGQRAINPVSGTYFPRFYDSNYGFLVDLDDAIKSPLIQGDEALRIGRQEPARAGVGKALGDMDDRFVKAIMDPNMVVPQYAARIARGEAAVRLEREIVLRYGREASREAKLSLGRLKTIDVGGVPYEVPPQVYNYLRGSLKDATTSLSQFLRSRPNQGPTTKALAQGVAGMEWIYNRWKRGVLVKRWSYHALNGVSDMALQIADGNRNAIGWNMQGANILQNRKLIKGTENLASTKRLKENVEGIMDTLDPSQSKAVFSIAPNEVSAWNRASAGTLEDKILYIARRYGMPVDNDLGMARLELGYKSRREVAREFETEARRGAKSRGEAAPMSKQYAAEAALDGAYKVFDLIVPVPGERLAKAWESSSKLGHFMWLLSQGSSPMAASRRTFATLLDYADAKRGEQIARWVTPFVTWIARAPIATARITARTPGKIATIHKAYQAFGSPDLDEDLMPSDETQRLPSYRVAERGASFYLGDFSRRYLGQAFKDIPERVQDSIRGSLAAGDWVVDNIIQNLPVPFIGGRPAEIPEEAGLVLLGRDPVGESMSMPFELSGLRGIQERGQMDVPLLSPYAADYLARSANPIIKGLYEYAFQRNAFTGAKYKGKTGLVPARFVVPKSDVLFVREFFDAINDSLAEEDAFVTRRADIDGLPFFTKHVLPFFLANPNSIAFINAYLYDQAGGMEAGAVSPALGGERPYVSGGQETVDLKRSIQAFNRFSPFPIYTTLPGERQSNAYRRINDALKAARKTLKVPERIEERKGE